MSGKIVPFLIFTILLINLPIYAGPDGVVKTIPSGQYPGGLTWDGQYLWLGSTSSSQLRTIDKIDTLDGRVVSSINEPRPEAAAEIRGLAWDGANLWVYRERFGSSTPDRWDYIYKMDTTGVVLDSIRSPFEDYCGGMAFADSSLWLSQYYSSDPGSNNVIHKIDTSSGAVQLTFSTVGEQPMGVASDGQYVWCAEDTGFGATRQEIYQYETSSGVYTGTFIKNPDNSPRDMAWDGSHFWLIGYNNQLIYKISAAGGTPQIQLPVSNLDFGLVSLGDTVTQSLNILNNGDAELVISALSIDTAAFFTNLSVLPLQITPGGSYVLDVSFSPLTQGPVNGSLVVESNDPLSPVNVVTLSGQGQLVEPAIWLSAYSHNFGNVWVPVEGKAKWTLQVANIGNQNLEIVDLILANSVFSAGGFSSYPITIVPNDTFDLAVYFEPAVAGTYQDSLIVASTDPANPFVRVELTGTGVLDDYVTGYQFWNFTVPDNPRAGSYQEYEVDGLRPINDINGDGVDEVVIATENYWLLCLDGAGSGTTDTLWSFITYISNSSAGSIGANLEYGVQDAIQVASDLNGDGFNDIVIATGGGNEHVYAIDGTNGAKLWEFGTDDPNSYGLGDFEAVDVRRDFNSDGVPDVLAIADGNQEGTGYKSAYLFNGPDGALIWQYNYPGPDPSFGKAIISVDDVTGDGQPDVMIGVGNNGSTGLKTYCLNGQTGFLVWDRDALTYEPKELVELPIPGESPDVIVGEYFSTVRRLDGETGIPIWSISFGGLSGIIQMERISDVDNDGIDDILVASFAAGATCLSGANGNYIWTFPTEFQFGIAAVPDLTGDGVEEVLFGTGNSSPTFGNFYCISGKGDSVLFSRYFPTDKVYTVHGIRSIDGNNSVDLLAGTRGGQVFCYSGGLEVISGMSILEGLIPEKYDLLQNYPNPFNPETIIRFHLPQKSLVSLKIINVLGQLVQVPLQQQSFEAGSHQLTFRAESLPSGVYIYQLESEFGILNRKMMLLK